MPTSPAAPSASPLRVAAPSRLVADELLRLLPLDVADVEVALRVGGDAVDPVALARLLEPVGPLRHRPQLQQLPAGVELHEHLVLRRAAQRPVLLAPLHRRR